MDWYPWGEEALKAAAAADKPIFLSIGYASCHWCHVMGHESFEDPETARLMNRLFINVKVDREERPDLDSIYMSAVQALTGRGGWPMSVWLTPRGEPFYAGTYFPPEIKHGQPSFSEVCLAIDNAWQEGRDQINDQATRLTTAIDQRGLPISGSSQVDLSSIDSGVEKLAESWDQEFGGFGQAPKFPQFMALSTLSRYSVIRDSEKARAIVSNCLDAMATGGIYDQIGGGFARYSVDRFWLVPHFEKMLYDQALAIQAYGDGYAISGNPFYAQVVTQTIEYCLGNLRFSQGGFASARDADSEGGEGTFYTWDKTEFLEVCGPQGLALAEFFWG